MVIAFVCLFLQVCLLKVSNKCPFDHTNICKFYAPHAIITLGFDYSSWFGIKKKNPNPHLSPPHRGKEVQ